MECSDDDDALAAEPARLHRRHDASGPWRRGDCGHRAGGAGLGGGFGWFSLGGGWGDDEAVADVADGADEGFVFGAELGAEAAYVDVDRASAAEVVVAPDFLQELLA